MLGDQLAERLDPYLALVPLAVGLLFLLGGAADLLRTLPRLRRARPADGVVLAARDSTTAGESTAWELTIGYDDDTGTPRQAAWRGDSGFDRTRYVPGMPVRLRYDPVDPGWVWLPGGGRVHPVLLPALFSVLGAAIVVGFLLLR